MKSQFEAIRYGDVEPSTPVWRYFDRPKFESLLRTSALWFSKLAILEDQQEGRAPAPTRELIEQECEQTAEWFADPGHQEQVRSSFERNEVDGREVLVVSCWTTNEPSDLKMWAAYAPDPDSIAIESTVGRLAASLPVTHDSWWIGEVEYVDMGTDTSMSSYLGHQAHERAFRKGLEFAREREIRVCTMNYVAPGCLNPDGSPQTSRQREGYVYDRDRNGILAMVDLSRLVATFHPAPNAMEEHHAGNRRLLQEAGIIPSCEELGWEGESETDQRF